MKYTYIILFLLGILPAAVSANDWDSTGKGGNAGTLTAEQAEAAWAAFPTVGPGEDMAPMLAMNWVVINAINDPAERPAVAARLAALLADAKITPVAKTYICQQLFRIGTEAEIPAVLPALLDPKTTDSARLFFERLESPKATEALRLAFDQLEGRARIGVMNSLSIRRDAKSVAKIIPLTRSEDLETRRAAWRALGNFGTEAAADFVISELKAAAEPNAPLESCAVRTAILLGDGEKSAEIYALLAQPCRGNAARQAGNVAKAGIGKTPEEWAASEDPALQKLAGKRFAPAAQLAGEFTCAELLDRLADAKTARSAAELFLAKVPEEAGPVLLAAVGSRPEVRMQALDILARMKYYSAIDTLVRLAREPDDAQFRDVIVGLRNLCDPDDIDLPRMFALSRDQKDAARRDTVERAIAFLCTKNADPEVGLKIILNTIQRYPELTDADVLPLLGRLGTAGTFEKVEAALASADPALKSAGIRALCNWPTADHADLLWEIAASDASADVKSSALRAYIRVVTLPGERAETETLAMLRKAFDLADTAENRNLALARAASIRTLETVDWLATFLDDAELNQTACVSLVQLAHHRFLRQPNKAHFEPILRKIERISNDPATVTAAEKARLGM